MLALLIPEELLTGKRRMRASFAIGSQLGAVRLSWLLLCSFLLSGCVAPKAELSAYRRSYELSRQASEQYILEGREQAKYWINNDSLLSPKAKQKKLDDTLAALQARMEALDALTSYNDALVALASGGNA